MSPSNVSSKNIPNADGIIPTTKDDLLLENKDTVADHLKQTKDEVLLYSREEEISKLQNAYETREKRHLVLLVGQTGNGKTSLGMTLQRQVEENDNGYFVTARFDSLEHPEPFAPFIQIGTQLIERVLKQHHDGRGSELKRIRKALLQKMDMSEIEVLKLIIPILEHLFPTKEQPTTSSSGTSNNNPHTHHGRSSFLVTFCNFMRSISHVKHPIVIFLDDLQSSDAGSLEILKILIADQKIQGVLCIAAFRPVGVKHPFSLLLRTLESGGIGFIPILPSGIQESSIMKWLISYNFDLSNDQLTTMATTICDGTKGNAFAIYICLKIMEQNKEIVRETGGTPLQAGGDVKSLFKLLFMMLSPSCQKVCWTASCMGTIIDPERLTKIVGTNINEISTALLEAESFGILIYEENKMKNITQNMDTLQLTNKNNDGTKRHRDLTTGYYRFATSTMKDCTYNLISKDDKMMQHTAIGNIYRQDVNSIGIYRVVAHLELAIDLLSPKGKEAFAKLCLQAGEDTSNWTEFASATKYLDLGIKLLDPNTKWKSNEQYQLSIALYSASADVYNCVGNYNAMDQRLLEILNNSKDSFDKLKAYTIQMHSLSSRTLHADAITLALKVLPKLGESIPSRRNKATVDSEIKSVRKLLEGCLNNSGGHGKESLLNTLTTQQKQKPLKDKEKKKLQDAMKILNLLLASALINGQASAGLDCLAPLVACKMVRVTIQNGLIMGLSAVGFSAFGSLLCTEGDILMGTFCSEVAIDIIENYATDEEKNCKGRVLAIHWGIVGRFQKPWKQCQEPLKIAYRLCMEGGDNEFAFISPILSILNMYVAGGPLSSVAEAMKSVYQLLYKKKQDTLMRMIRPFFQEVLNLMGATMETNPETLSGNIMNEEEDLRYAEENFNIKILFCIYLCKAELSFFLHKFGPACDYIEKCKELATTDMMISSLAIKQVFLDAMTSIAMIWEGNRCCPSTKKAQSKEFIKRRKKYLTNATNCLAKLKELSRHAPENISQKVYLVEAEIEALEGDIDTAIDLFKKAMEHAEKYGALADRTLACERAGLALRGCGKEDDSLDYLEDCCGYYRQWGALVKVNHVKGNVIPQAIFDWDD